MVYSKKSMILLMIRMQVHLYKVTLFTQTCQRNELLKSNNPFYNCSTQVCSHCFYCIPGKRCKKANLAPWYLVSIVVQPSYLCWAKMINSTETAIYSTCSEEFHLSLKWLAQYLNLAISLKGPPIPHPTSRTCEATTTIWMLNSKKLNVAELLIGLYLPTYTSGIAMFDIKLK